MTYLLSHFIPACELVFGVAFAGSIIAAAMCKSTKRAYDFPCGCSDKAGSKSLTGEPFNDGFPVSKRVGQLAETSRTGLDLAGEQAVRRSLLLRGETAKADNSRSVTIGDGWVNSARRRTDGIVSSHSLSAIPSLENSITLNPRTRADESPLSLGFLLSLHLQRR